MAICGLPKSQRLPRLFRLVFILRPCNGVVEPLLRAQAEALDQLALESVVRNCLRLEFGAAEITDALSGIGDDLSNHLALHGIGARPLQRRLRSERQSARRVEAVMAGRYLAGGANLACDRHVRIGRVPGLPKYQQW